MTASASFSASGGFAMLALCCCFFSRSWLKAKTSYSSQVVSVFSIQNGRTVTKCWGPSSSERLNSPGGVPMVNVPPGIGIISNFTPVPGMVSV